MPDALYHTTGRIVRPVDVTEVEAYFFRKEQRRVDPTFSDVSIDTRLYKVDPRLRGMQVQVLFNSLARDPQQPDEVKLFDVQDVYVRATETIYRRSVATTVRSDLLPLDASTSQWLTETCLGCAGRSA